MTGKKSYDLSYDDIHVFLRHKQLKAVGHVCRQIGRSPERLSLLISSDTTLSRLQFSHATMASHQLAIAKASFSAGLLRPDPTSVSRDEITTFHSALDQALSHCSYANIQV